MTKKISWLVSLSCIVLVLMLSIVFFGCKEKKYDLKIESSKGGNVSITVGDKKHTLEDLDSETFKVKENATVTLIATAKTGYEFEKWILNDSFSYSEELKINISSDSTYVAVFTPSAYTLTFKHNGNIVGTTNVYITSNLESVTYPAMNGYENVTWEEINFDKTNPSNVVVNTLTGTPIDYSIMFKDENDVLIEEYTWNVENKNITAPTVPAKTGYDAEWAEYSFDDLNNKIIKPVYTIHNYTLTFKNGDYVIKTQNINVETDLATIQYPTMKGYNNVTWDSLVFDKENPNNVVVRTITADLINYTLNYKINGELVLIGSINVETDLSNILLLNEFAGYENIVWGPVDFDKSNPANTEINAISADLINYTITFVAEDDTVIETIEWNAENKDFVVPQAPEKEGYTAEWQSYNLKQYENKEVKPVYTPINYTITFTDENGAVVGEVLTWNIENKTITEPVVPEKTGFVGAWTEYNFDTLQDINVGVTYSKVLDIKYLNIDDSEYDEYDPLYDLYTRITVVKTVKVEDSVVVTYEVKVRFNSQDRIHTIDELINHLKDYSIEENYEIVKIGNSTDFVEGVINAYENSTELKLYFDWVD